MQIPKRIRALIVGMGKADLDQVHGDEDQEEGEGFLSRQRGGKVGGEGEKVDSVSGRACGASTGPLSGSPNPHLPQSDKTSRRSCRREGIRRRG